MAEKCDNASRHTGLVNSQALRVTLKLTNGSSADTSNASIDSELLLGYEGSAESGLLRDPALRAWRDEHREEINELLQQLHREADALPPEPIAQGERILLRAFKMDSELDDA